MLKKYFRLLALLTLLALLLAACGGAAGTGTTGDGTAQVPETGGTGAAPGTGNTGGTGSTGGACVGVDTQALMTAGQAVYTENCAGCHGEQGEGQEEFPALAAGEVTTAEDVAALVQTYFSVEAHPKTLSADELAGVLTFVRGSFGNTASAVCVDQITIPMP